jgi:hypothetical protein
MSKIMKTRNVAAGLIIVLAMLMFDGCYKPWHHVEGNMDVETEFRDVSSFEKVFNEGNFDVYIIQDGKSEVEIEAESNLIPLISTHIEGSVLVIETHDDLRNNYPMKIYVHADEIDELRLSGSGLLEAAGLTTGNLEIDLSGSGSMFYSGTSDDVNCDLSGSGNIGLDLDSDHLEADISGSGDIEVFGTANDADLKISGSGSFHAYEFLIQDCHTKISGSGSMYLNVEDYLYVNISGSGNVYYLGNPSLDVDISGSGSVIHP